MPVSFEMKVLLVAGIAAVALRLNLWRAVLCIWPRAIRIESEEPAGALRLPAELEPLHQELLALGFAPIGSHSEKSPLQAPSLSYDYALEGERMFASAELGRDGPRVYFLTRTAEGFVITANYRRPAREESGRYRYLSGSIEEAKVERVFRAHQRRVRTFGEPLGPNDLEARVEVARAWLQGPGENEIRAQHVRGLLWTVASLGMVGQFLFEHL